MHMAELLAALSPIAGLAVNSLFLTCMYRVKPSFGLLRGEYAGFVFGAAAVLGINGALFMLYFPEVDSDEMGSLLLSLLSYAALGYCHFHFVNLGETARRIRLLRELYHAGGSLSHSELLCNYNAREVFEKRIARLLSTGQIILRDNRYFINSLTMVQIARLIVRLKIILLGKTSEHDN